jgi:CYTH domain-containing protein
MIEIERKFLVTSEAFKKESFRDMDIVQGFLNTHPERTVRVRMKGDKAFLTVKGKSNTVGTIRAEWETEISVVDAEQLLKLCEDGVIEKRRYEVKVGDHIFEVDEFFGNNDGLTIAEIELNYEDESFEKPAWLGKEVTGELKYYNSLLSKHPYKNWDT